MIGSSEGTRQLEGSDDGYNVDVGGKLFGMQNDGSIDYSDHPRIHVQLNPRLVSTAAGRYQILEHNYDYYANLLGLNDFSPESQDAIARQMIKERAALDDIAEGDFNTGIEKCKNLWASFPGAGYNQRENQLEKLQEYYTAAGGTLTESAA
jgi:muramidase (phage lysozyme)